MERNDDGLDYEISLRYLVEKSNKRAWLITFISIGLTLLAFGTLFALMPLKSVEPFVVRVDKVTGMVDVMTAVDENTMKYDESMDKYFASEYVKRREGYHYDLLQQDYIYIQLNSSKEIVREYKKIYSGDNARDQVLKDQTEITPKIISVTLNKGGGSTTARIRLDLTRKTKNRASIKSIKIVTLSYKYFPRLIQTEEERLLNPLGFKVMTYRVDREVH
jgi:type IV secretion system protein VirB8